MKNVLIISTTEEEMLSNVNDGTNRLFINGSEIPSSDWVGTGNYTATVEGHAVTIAKADTLDGNISLARTGDYTYEMRRRTPSGEVPDITASASVDANTGTPSVNVTKSGTDMNPNFDFAFHNLKGETGATGATPNVTASAIVDANTGTPAVTVTKTGTAENPNFAFDFQNLKGEYAAVDSALSTTSENPVQNKVITNALGDKVAKTGDTMTGGLKVNNGGLYVKGRVYDSGDDEGIVVGFADNGWSGVMLGGSSGRHAAFYLKDDTPQTPPFLRYRDANNNAYDVRHPAKSGTMALLSDVQDALGNFQFMEAVWYDASSKPAPVNTEKTYTTDGTYLIIGTCPTTATGRSMVLILFNTVRGNGMNILNLSNGVGANLSLTLNSNKTIRISGTGYFSASIYKVY